MKKKIFTLMTLLLAVCSGAWANYSAASADGKITLTWDFAEFTSPNNKTLTTGQSIAYSGLTMYGGGGSNAESVDKNGFRFQGATNQWNSTWGRYIVFTPAYNGTIKVYGKAGGSSVSRHLSLTTALSTPSATIEGNTVAVSDALSTTAALAFTYSSATNGTTYYIEADNGIYVTKVEFIFDVAAAVAPTFNPNGGEVDGGSTVTLSGQALSFYYQWKDAATDLTPASSGWTEGATIIVPNENKTGKYLYAYASNGSGYEGSVTSKTFDITKVVLTVTAPTITKSEIFTSANKTVTITKTDEESSIKYSTDGGETWLDYTAALTITSTTTVKAKAVRDGYNDSDIVTATYIKPVAGTSGSVSDLVTVSSGYTFIAENYTPSANSLYDGNRVFTLKANTTKTDKGSIEIDGVNHYNYWRMSNKSSAGENLVFKTSGACVLTVYSQSVNLDNFHVGSTADGTDYASTRATASSTGVWSCIIPQAGLVYITAKATNDYCIAGFKLTALPTFKLNASGYSTFSYNQPVEIVSGAKAYTAALDFANSTITCTEITSNKIPAGNGVLMYGEANADIVVKTAFGDVDALVGNNLHGTTAADGSLVAKGSNSYYVLSGDTFKNYTGAAFAANKAYFEVDGDDNVQAREWSIVFEGDETTGINTVLGSEFTVNGEYYDLQGRRVAQPTKGLYIVNGRKVVIK